MLLWDGRTWAMAIGMMLAAPCMAWAGYTFASIDGGALDLDDWRGKPVLVVNTASLCAFAPQFDDLQTLQDRYGAQGLVVLAVPSDDFRQELDSGAEVKSFCATNFDLTLPMTDITSVIGPSAHPFYAWLRDAHGVEPGWNFNKVLIGPDGAYVASWGSNTNPVAQAITRKIEQLLP